MADRCPHCGGEISAASILSRGKKKTMTAEAREQRKQAALSRWAKIKGVGKDVD